MSAPGELLADRYRLERLLGEGGMGEVWRAHDKRLGRDVAVKLLRSTASEDSDPEEIQQERLRLLREGRAVAAVEHDNVVTVYDVLDEGDAPFLSMELLEGRSLRQHLDEVGPLDPRTACALLVQVARGLAAAHAQNIVHRDLKPANIFLRGKGDVSASTKVKVLDFGIAKLLHRPASDVPEGAAGEAPPQPTTAALENLTREGCVLGSPCYMSPEQVDRKPEIDRRTDIWSLGIVLYECLSGSDKLPTRGDDTEQVFKIIQNVRIRPIEEVVPDVPTDVARLLGRVLAKDPADRPESMQEVADVLERVATDRAERSPDTVGPDSLAGLVLSGAGIQGGEPTAAELKPPAELESPPAELKPPAELESPPAELEPPPAELESAPATPPRPTFLAPPERLPPPPRRWLPAILSSVGVLLLGALFIIGLSRHEASDLEGIASHTTGPSASGNPTVIFVVSPRTDLLTLPDPTGMPVSGTPVPPNTSSNAPVRPTASPGKSVKPPDPIRKPVSPTPTYASSAAPASGTSPDSGTVPDDGNNKADQHRGGDSITEGGRTIATGNSGNEGSSWPSPQSSPFHSSKQSKQDMKAPSVVMTAAKRK